MKSAAKSDVGKIRQNNEDSVLVDDDLGIYLLADGMGGCAGGEIASSLAVETAYDYLKKLIAHTDQALFPKLIAEALARAHSAVSGKSLSDSDLAGMGTTLEIVVVKEKTAFICHTGDSRVYLLRGDTLRRITVDDNMAAWLMEREHVPESAVSPGARHLLTQAVGGSSSPIPALHTLELAGNDIIIICSDGLTEMLEDRVIARIAGHYHDQPDKAAEALVAEANARGGYDNVSVVLIRVGNEPFPAGTN